MKKVAIIGSGNVGATAALLLAGDRLADIYLLDVAEGIPQGKSLDLAQSLAMLGSDSRVIGTNSYDDLKSSDIVVITAGLPRKPGMSRADLLNKNASIVGSVAAEMMSRAPEAILLIVTNPLDVMTHLAYKVSGFAPERVLGMGGLLDSARMRYFLAQAGSAKITDVEAMVVGAHSDRMVPLFSRAKISGRSVKDLFIEAELERIKQKTINGGAEIVSHLKSGSAFYAPGAAAAFMCKAILNDEKEMISTCCLARGQYGLENIYINLPARIGHGGVEEIAELTLSDEETEELQLSAESVRQSIKELPS